MVSWHQMPTPPTSESTPPRELGTHVSALSALLTRSELDDELLDAVCGGWEAGGDRQRAQRLRQAVDAFDFRSCSGRAGYLD